MTEMIDIGIKKALIRKQPVFSPLNDEEIETLATLLLEKHMQPGDVIVKEGDPVDSIYIIARGKVDVKRPVPGQPGQLQTIATLGADAAIGLNETGFYSLSGRRTATVVAATDTLLLRLSVAAFNGFALANTHVSEVMRHHTAKLLGL